MWGTPRDRSAIVLNIHMLFKQTVRSNPHYFLVILGQEIKRIKPVEDGSTFFGSLETCPNIVPFERTDDFASVFVLGNVW